MGLHSLGSALWGDDLCCHDKPRHSHALTTFLYGLRALLRSSLSVAVVTLPSHLIQVIWCLTHTVLFVLRASELSLSVVVLNHLGFQPEHWMQINMLGLILKFNQCAPSLLVMIDSGAVKVFLYEQYGYPPYCSYMEGIGLFYQAWQKQWKTKIICLLCSKPVYSLRKGALNSCVLQLFDVWEAHHTWIKWLDCSLSLQSSFYSVLLMTWLFDSGTLNRDIYDSDPQRLEFLIAVLDC